MLLQTAPRVVLLMLNLSLGWTAHPRKEHCTQPPRAVRKEQWEWTGWFWRQNSVTSCLTSVTQSSTISLKSSQNPSKMKSPWGPELEHDPKVFIHDLTGHISYKVSGLGILPWPTCNFYQQKLEFSHYKSRLRNVVCTLRASVAEKKKIIFKKYLNEKLLLSSTSPFILRGTKRNVHRSPCFPGPLLNQNDER